MHCPYGNRKEWNLLGKESKMRVLCEWRAELIEGEIVAGNWCDPERTVFDFDGTFTVRCDDGEVFRVNGWMGSIEVLDGSVEDLHSLKRVVYRE